MARFLHDLNREIQDIVELQQYATIGELVYQAIKVEMKIKRNLILMVMQGVRRGMKIGLGRTKVLRRGEEKEPTSPSDSKSSSIKCFKFLGKGHISSQCPNRRTIVLRENGEVSSESTHEGSTSSSEKTHFEGNLLMLRRLVSNLVGEETKNQSETIFHSRCLILCKLCSLIIDEGV
ncbi:hypothetical protein CR513_13589, partial [Mucuna pruriens]